MIDKTGITNYNRGMTDEHIKGAVLLRILFLTFKYIFNPELLHKLDDIFRRNSVRQSMNFLKKEVILCRQYTGRSGMK